MRRIAALLLTFGLAGAALAHTPLTAGVYYCRGFTGRDLRALTLQLYSDGRYSNVPASAYGTYEYKEGKIHFVGGHLAGEVGDRLDRDTFRLGVEQCRLNRGQASPSGA